MVKLLVFAILLVASPANGLIEKLFNTESSCYSGCATNYAASSTHLNSCRKGCDITLQGEDCPTQCKSFSTDESVQASCQVGCTLSSSVNKTPEKPVVAVDPVPEIKNPGIIPLIPGFPGSERPRSIILIRLRQRPSIQMPSAPNFFNDDPIQMFNDIIRRFQEKSNEFEQSIRKTFVENSKDLPKPPEFGTISELVKNIPIIRLPANVHPDSSESAEDKSDQRPLIDEFRHVIKHPREHQQYIRERMQPVNNKVQQFFTDIRSEWNDLVRKQPKIPIWIFIGILLSSSAILWYMVMALCRHTPSRSTLSVRAQELVFHPYDYDTYEKEKIQPDDQPYEVTESLPIKVKLSNI